MGGPATSDIAKASDGRLIVLDRDECVRRLGRGGIGRVAVSLNALPAIFPVNYAMLDGDVVFRTGRGTKFDAAVAGSILAFEIDHAEAMSHGGWSVLVVGAARPITDPATLARAEALPLTPWASGDRDVFVRIETAIITGRRLSSGRQSDENRVGPDDPADRSR